MIVPAACCLGMVSCSTPAEPVFNPHHNSPYVYVEKPGAHFSLTEKYYAPVYSDIYHQDGAHRFYLTVTLSIRNVSMRDTLAITAVDYYNTEGLKLKTYLDSVLILRPLESIEYIVPESESQGGAGANFMVDCSRIPGSHPPLIQTVMIGTFGQQGISFLSEAVLTGPN